ncbi:MAG TPA: ATP-binding protein [Verrucomicrobiae bacterium]
MQVALFFFCADFLIGIARGQAVPVVTNLAQIRTFLDRQGYVVADLRLEAAVAACSTNTGMLILQDASGVESVEVEGCRDDFHGGDLIQIQGGRCLLRTSDYGVYISEAPLVNNDGLHALRTMSRLVHFEAGRYPATVDWFNQSAGFALEVSCVAVDSGESRAGGLGDGKLLHATDAACFQGWWTQVPNFQLLQRVKAGSVTNFDIAFRSRDDLVGIRFNGYFDAPRAGNYLFTLASDDGSRLWIGNPGVPVRKVGAVAPPQGVPAVIGEALALEHNAGLATVEGRVTFVAVSGKGLRFEMGSERNTVLVKMADAGLLAPADLLHATVRVSGLAHDVLTENGRMVLGDVIVASANEVTIVGNAPGKGPLPPVLTTVMQVHSLSSEDAERRIPVKIEGVVTTGGQPNTHWMVIQDSTRGTFVNLAGVTNCLPVAGEVWAVSGFTGRGDFAPVIVAREARFLGQGRMPEPARVSWSQLVNGSMDVQWVELQGIVTGVSSNRLTLLMPEGHQVIMAPEWGEAELRAFDKAVVRVRGTLFAAWNAQTHEVVSGNVIMHNVSITVDKAAPEDPFNAPEKTPRGFFHFDVRATPFQRVKVRGQVTYIGAKRIFLEQDAGIQVLPAVNVALHAGDFVEAVGFPDIFHGSPLLREALIRKTSAGVLPEAALVSERDIGGNRFAASRLRLVGRLAGQYVEDSVSVLQIQMHSHIFLARVGGPRSLRALRYGSELSLTGVFVTDGGNNVPVSGISQFELQVNGPDDVVVLSQPSWWTLQRLLSVVGVLLVTLALAMIWITQLKRQVAQRTLQLQREIRERERAQRQQELEAERSRIARDLHDDLGASLTEINVLASTGQRPRSGEETHPALFRAIADKARSLVAALDVIVWAVDPEDNSLQSLADYLSGYTREFLSNSNISCRFKIPITFPDATLPGQLRHEVLMVVKESLNNIVRHAGATEVEFQMNLAADFLEISIADNGKGFDANAGTDGHGLKNRLARLTSIGGSCAVESHGGAGTRVSIRLPMAAAKDERRAD